MKPLDGVELPTINQEALAKNAAAKRDRLVEIVGKIHEERETHMYNMEKSKKAYETQLKKDNETLEKIDKRIEQILSGNWNVIQEDSKGQPNVQGGDNKKGGGGKPEGGDKPAE